MRSVPDLKKIDTWSALCSGATEHQCSLQVTPEDWQSPHVPPAAWLFQRTNAASLQRQRHSAVADGGAAAAHWRPSWSSQRD